MSAKRFSMCPECREWDWIPHECPPVFDVWIADYHDSRADAWQVRATGPQHAAERFAALWDEQGDYHIAQGSETAVLVAEAGSPTVQRFNVRGCYEPVYSAEEVA